jgi:hypothetical protein
MYRRINSLRKNGFNASTHRNLEIQNPLTRSILLCSVGSGILCFTHYFTAPFTALLRGSRLGGLGSSLGGGLGSLKEREVS